MKSLSTFILIFFLILAIPIFANAQQRQECPDPGTITNPVPVGSEYCGTITDFVIKIMKFVGTIIGFLAICFVVYAGVRFLIANGDPGAISKAKTSLTYTVAGFVISVFAYAVVVAIESFLGVKDTNYDQDAFINPFGDGVTLDSLAHAVLKDTLLLTGTIALFMIILNGVRYLTARGDDKQISAAKSGLTWSLIGLAIILFAYVIINAVARLIS
jgi:hypothetical protein